MLTLLVGCDSNSPPTTPTPPVVIGPQEKFDRVIAELRRGLGDEGPLGGGQFTFSDDTGLASAATTYIIDAPEKIKLPTEPGQVPTVTIRVTQSSSYSAVSDAPTEEGEEEQPDETSSRRRRKENQQTPLGDEFNGLGGMGTTDESGMEVIDPSLIAGEGGTDSGPRIKIPDLSNRTVTSDTVVTYDLVYENQRWRYAKPPAADAPEATNLAMELALKRQ